jgi:vanillate O-demethylase ferredoxin subunit
MVSAGTLEVRLATVTPEAEGIALMELHPLGRGLLPAFSAGAHIDLLLANGLVRSYSLTNPQDERHRYVIAVNRDASSRGGSQFIHERLAAGDTVRISVPRNNFRLVEDAPHVVLIAGGIGITPLWCMIQRLRALGRSWELHYCARTRERAAFLRELQSAGSAGQVHFNFDHEPGGRMLDVPALVARASREAHLYCCGPAPLLSAFQEATRSRPAAQLHVEYFGSGSLPSAARGGFTVVLASSGEEIPVPAGNSILDTLLDRGLDLPHSCKEGVCGSCETRVLAGVPDHRDLVMSDEERVANCTMMICCSGSKTEKLVLDL